MLNTPANIADFEPLTDLQERDRLDALARVDLLDTPREEGFDRIARLIRNIFEVPVATVSLIDGHRQWHKSVEGLDVREAEKKDTFCRLTILRNQPLIVQDASKDERFADNPFVIGSPNIRFYAGVPLRTHDGHNIGTLCAIGFEPRGFSKAEEKILHDLARVAMDQIELRTLATIDSLTGVLSRPSFKAEGQRAVALAHRHKQDLTCIALDLDHFKAVNDTYGHAAGDTVLQATAEACRAELRRTDIIGRLGGEEFAVLLPHTDLTAGQGVAEKLRARVSKLKFGPSLKSLRITSSFGIAAVSRGIRNIDTLLANADVALYDAKSAGRNTCRIWQRSDSTEKPARRRVLKAGRILLNDRKSVVDCTVRSLADDGAGIDVSTTIGLSEKFTLSIQSEDFEAPCRVTAKSEKHLEVEFL